MLNLFSTFDVDERRLYVLSLLDFNETSALLELENDDAEVAVDVMLKILESPSRFHHGARQSNDELRRLVLKLANMHGIRPAALILNGVVREDDEPRSEGGYGAIYYGKFGNTPVAIKRLKVFQSMTGETLVRLRQDFFRECILWKGLNHSHILPFLGVSETSFRSGMCIIVPWMDNGRIRDHMARLRDEGELVGQDFPVAVNKWLHQTALGLMYLHDEKVVHGDLHGGNILVDANGDVKLTDFGMSVSADGTPFNYGSQHGGGALRWTAPELMDGDEFGLPNRRPTRQSDVYSFACVCVELYSMQRPWPELEADYQVIVNVVDGKRPARPLLLDGGELSDEVWALISSSWDHEPSLRPSAEEVVRQMEGINALPTSELEPHFDAMTRQINQEYLSLSSKPQGMPRRRRYTRSNVDSSRVRHKLERLDVPENLRISRHRPARFVLTLCTGTGGHLFFFLSLT